MVKSVDWRLEVCIADTLPPVQLAFGEQESHFVDPKVLENNQDWQKVQFWSELAPV